MEKAARSYAKASNGGSSDNEELTERLKELFLELFSGQGLRKVGRDLQGWSY